MALDALAGLVRHRPEWRTLVAGPDAAGMLARGALPADLAARLRAFLDRFGHRALSEGELRARTWREDPSPVLAGPGHAGRGGARGRLHAERGRRAAGGGGGGRLRAGGSDPRRPSRPRAGRRARRCPRARAHQVAGGGPRRRRAAPGPRGRRAPGRRGPARHRRRRLLPHRRRAARHPRGHLSVPSGAPAPAAPLRGGRGRPCPTARGPPAGDDAPRGGAELARDRREPGRRRGSGAGRGPGRAGAARAGRGPGHAGARRRARAAARFGGGRGGGDRRPALARRGGGARARRPLRGRRPRRDAAPARRASACSSTAARARCGLFPRPPTGPSGGPIESLPAASPADEPFHPLEAHPLARESVYVNAQDPATGIVLVSSVGARPGGRGEALLAIGLPDGRVLFALEREALEAGPSGVTVGSVEAGWAPVRLRLRRPPLRARSGGLPAGPRAAGGRSAHGDRPVRAPLHRHHPRDRLHARPAGRGARAPAARSARTTSSSRAGGRA